MAYSRVDIYIMVYSQGDICIHCIPKRAFAFITYPRGIRIMTCTNGTFASWNTPKRTFASQHAPRGHSHHYTPIRVHLHHDIPTRDIRIMARTNGTFASWYITKGHLHHSMHQWTIHIHCITKGAFASQHTPKRTFASQYEQKDICIMTPLQEAFTS